MKKTEAQNHFQNISHFGICLLEQSTAARCDHGAQTDTNKTHRTLAGTLARNSGGRAHQSLVAEFHRRNYTLLLHNPALRAVFLHGMGSNKELNSPHSKRYSQTFISHPVVCILTVQLSDGGVRD